MIQQFVPQEACLKCLGCCRFREANSVWLPCLLEEEALELIDKDIPAVSIDSNKRIMPVPHPGGENFLCAFLDAETNRCQIYTMRPFECQLYPFLINLRGKKVVLTVDMKCPFIQEKINTPEFKEYCTSLAHFLNSPKQIRLLRDNPQLIQAYEDVLDVIELDL